MALKNENDLRRLRRRRMSGVFLALVASSLVVGCELIVDFDRTRIPVEGTDATVPETGTIDAPAQDAPADAPADAGEDGGDTDAGTDAAADADADA